MSVWAMSLCPHTARCGTGTLWGFWGSAASIPGPATPFPGPFPIFQRPHPAPRCLFLRGALSAALNLISCSSGVGALGGEGERSRGGSRGVSEAPLQRPGGKTSVGAWGGTPGAVLPIWLSFPVSTLRWRGCRGIGKLGHRQGCGAPPAVPVVPTAHPCPTEGPQPAHPRGVTLSLSLLPSQDAGSWHRG